MLLGHTNSPVVNVRLLHFGGGLLTNNNSVTIIRNRQIVQKSCILYEAIFTAIIIVNLENLTFNCLLWKYSDWRILTTCVNTGIFVVHLKNGITWYKTRHDCCNIGSLIHTCIFTSIFPQLSDKWTCRSRPAYYTVAAWLLTHCVHWVCSIVMWGWCDTYLSVLCLRTACF